MAKMSKGGFSRSTIEETQYLIKKHYGKVREENKRGIMFPGYEKVNTAIERHLAMLHQNHMDGCLHCQYGTAKYP